MLRPALCEDIGQLPLPRPADFEWDEWKFQSYFYYAYEAELARLKALTHKANIALALAVCEWIEERFRPLNTDRTLLDYIAAGWAGLVDRDYTEYFTLVDDQWIGPVRAPLMAALGIINEAFFESGDDPEQAWRSCYAINLARHIMPAEEPFATWLEASIRLLEHYHSWEAEGPFEEDIFAEEVHQGNLVPREVFDLARPYDPAEAEQLLMAFIDRIDPDNPFLAADEEEDDEDDA